MILCQVIYCRYYNIGDIALNYRYQLLFREAVALAPRFSTLLPTGDYKEGFGSGALGYQVNVPLSLEFSGKFVNHWNMGTTITPGNKEAGGAVQIPLDTTLEPVLSGLYRKILTSCVRGYGIPLNLFREMAQKHGMTRFLLTRALDLPLTLNPDCRLCLEFPFQLVWDIQRTNTVYSCIFRLSIACFKADF